MTVQIRQLETLLKLIISIVQGRRNWQEIGQEKIYFMMEFCVNNWKPELKSQTIE